MHRLVILDTTPLVFLTDFFPFSQSQHTQVLQFPESNPVSPTRYIISISHMRHGARTRKGLRGKIAPPSLARYPPPLPPSLPSPFNLRSSVRYGAASAKRGQGRLRKSVPRAAGKPTVGRARATMTAVGDFLAKEAEVFLAAQDAAVSRETGGNIFHLAMTSWFT